MMTCDKIKAKVPSIVLGDPGHRNFPYFDPTMLAAESPIPTEVTPLERTIILLKFLQKNYQN